MSQRLFVAVDLSTGARAAIRDATAALRRRLSAIESEDAFRWVAPENLHLTLRFLGNVEDEAAARVREAMQAPIDVAPFVIVLRELGTFPPRGTPRVLYVALADGLESMRALRDAVDRRLAPLCTWEAETRPYTPHLTLARFNAGPKGTRRPAKFNPVEFSRLIADIAWPEVRFEATQATLFSSITRPSGPMYTAEARAALRS